MPAVCQVQHKKARQHGRHDTETAGNSQTTTGRLLPVGIYKNIIQSGASYFFICFHALKLNQQQPGNVI